MDNIFLVVILGLALIVCVYFLNFTHEEYSQYVKNEQAINMLEEHKTNKPTDEMSDFFKKYPVEQLKINYKKPKVILNKTVIDVPVVNQYPELPTGCEIASTTALLKYIGIHTEKTELKDKYFEIKDTFTYNSQGEKIGPDPYQVFVGDPTSGGFGCMSDVVEKTIDKYFKQNGLLYDAIQINGIKENDLEKLLDNGIPVIVWASRNMKPFKYYESNEWILDTTGKKFTWPSNAHVLVICGYDDKNYYFSDSDNKKEIVFYKKSDFVTRWEEFGSQAVIVKMNV